MAQETGWGPGELLALPRRELRAYARLALRARGVDPDQAERQEFVAPSEAPLTEELERRLRENAAKARRK